jgi:hypothetical protein
LPCLYGRHKLERKMAVKTINTKRTQSAAKSEKNQPLPPSTGNRETDELLESMRRAGERLRSNPEAAREYLLSTGIYTKTLKLKKRFRNV